jgi:hypothetical protein
MSLCLLRLYMFMVNMLGIGMIECLRQDCLGSVSAIATGRDRFVLRQAWGSKMQTTSFTPSVGRDQLLDLASN